MKHTLTILLVATITSCSFVADMVKDAVLPDKGGIDVDAQIGSNENKVQTGLGSLGNKSTNTISVEDSKEATVHNSDGRYHLQTEGETTVNVYETNRWLFAIFGIYIIGKPALRWFWNRKKRLHPHEYITYTSVSPNASGNRTQDD